MKTHKWKLPVTYDGKPDETKFEAEMVTMHKSNHGIVTSTGLINLDEKIVGNCVIESSDHWTKPRKVTIPRKQITYVLAHKLAIKHHTHGKKGAADKIVAKWFKVNERVITKARNFTIHQHYKKLGIKNSISLIFTDNDGTEKSYIFLDGENLNINENGLKYFGRCYFWVKGDESMTAARIPETGLIKL